MVKDALAGALPRSISAQSTRPGSPPTMWSRGGDGRRQAESSATHLMCDREDDRKRRRDSSDPSLNGGKSVVVE